MPLVRGRTLLLKSSIASAALRRSYSHGVTVGQVYDSYRKLDEHLAHVRPDILTEKEKLDLLLAEGKITPNIAEHFKKEIDVSNEAKKTAEYWRKVLWYVGIPLTILVGVNTYFLEEKHAEHLEEHPHEPPVYPHLRIRSKKFFWGDGDHTPFHNPKVNGP